MLVSGNLVNEFINQYNGKGVVCIYDVDNRYKTLMDNFQRLFLPLWLERKVQKKDNITQFLEVNYRGYFITITIPIDLISSKSNFTIEVKGQGVKKSKTVTIQELINAGVLYVPDSRNFKSSFTYAKSLDIEEFKAMFKENYLFASYTPRGFFESLESLLLEFKNEFYIPTLMIGEYPNTFSHKHHHVLVYFRVKGEIFALCQGYWEHNSMDNYILNEKTLLEQKVTPASYYDAFEIEDIYHVVTGFKELEGVDVISSILELNILEETVRQQGYFEKSENKGIHLVDIARRFTSVYKLFEHIFNEMHDKEQVAHFAKLAVTVTSNDLEGSENVGDYLYREFDNVYKVKKGLFYVL